MSNKGRPLNFRFTAFNGRDVWKNWMSEKWQARAIAKVLLRGQWKGADAETTDLVIHMGLGTYRIVQTGPRIKVVPHERDVGVRGAMIG